MSQLLSTSRLREVLVVELSEGDVTQYSRPLGEMTKENAEFHWVDDSDCDYIYILPPVSCAK